MTGLPVEIAEKEAGLIIRFVRSLAKKYAPMRVSRQGLYNPHDLTGMLHGFSAKFNPQTHTVLRVHNLHIGDFERLWEELQTVSAKFDIGFAEKGISWLEHYGHEIHNARLNSDARELARQLSEAGAHKLNLEPLLSNLPLFEKVVDELESNYKRTPMRVFSNALGSVQRSIVRGFRYELRQGFHPRHPPMATDDFDALKNAIISQLTGKQARVAGHGQPSFTIE